MPPAPTASGDTSPGASGAASPGASGAASPGAPGAASPGAPGAASPAELILRSPRPEDEAQALQAQLDLAPDDFNFLLLHEGMSWADWLAKVDRERAGTDLPPGRVPATFLFAVVGEEIVGRIHIRHALTDHLLELGGHVGYGVRPAYRRRGYATEMLRQALVRTRELGIEDVLVTCDDDNPGSVGTIVACGGVLEDKRPRTGGKITRRYWISP